MFLLIDILDALLLITLFVAMPFVGFWLFVGSNV